ncbi:MAG TPA: phage tail sheath C-terminal domain-containing protein [Anaerolineae bacterium]|nr:phage tail sheath C-terminal domain-containing protein [Anaerolineae bacterium]
MPATLTFPGVYIEEIPSGVRTITGVATSVTAFVGRARRGPVDEPISLSSFAEFERLFGGLWADSALGFAVRDFYLNGGAQALIVRLYRAESGSNVKRANALLDVNGLTLEAASPGAWGNHLRARVDYDTRQSRPDEAPDSLFNLTLKDDKTGQIESFRNVSITPGHPRQVDKVLANASRLVRSTGALPGARPNNHPDPSSGQDAFGDHTPATHTQVIDQNRASDGLVLGAADFIGSGKEANKQGLFALEKADLFNLLCIPPYTLDGNADSSVVGAAAQYCEKRRALLVVDPPADWTDKQQARTRFTDPDEDHLGTRSKNAALFFPRLRQPNPLRENQIEDFAPCGAVAGIIARTDAQRGVWKAPAGLDAALVGVPQLSVALNDADNGELNPLGINCLRPLPAAGRVIWGARTLQGDDRLASEWKYIPVRRLALFIEESLYRGTQWAVFEPNDEPLWSQIRLNVNAFMQNLFRQGAFQGRTPREAYFVKCDKETNPQDDINRGIVNVVVGFAPLKPAEFVIIKIQQIAGQIQA